MDRIGARIGFSHGGGALGAILGRLNLGWERTKGFGGKAATSPQSVARKLFYDSNVYDQFYLDHLVKNLPGRVFLGTDYPYDLMQREPAAFIDSAIRSPADRDAIRFGAALSFLNEDVGKIVNPAHTNHSAERTAP